MLKFVALSLWLHALLLCGVWAFSQSRYFAVYKGSCTIAQWNAMLNYGAKTSGQPYARFHYTLRYDGNLAIVQGELTPAQEAFVLSRPYAKPIGIQFSSGTSKEIYDFQNSTEWKVPCSSCP